MEKQKKLAAAIQPLAHYPHHTRVHRLKIFSTDTLNCYVKRDDELSFGISGSKLRKYLSLIPYLIEKKIESAVLIGGSHSNNILSLSQLLIENDIEPILFLLGDENYPLRGNLLFTRLFVPEKNIHWISRKEWPKVENLGQDYRKHNTHKRIEIIAEGASMAQALPGAVTLALDIIQNEQMLNKQFNHLFIDAGTGLMAIANVLAFTWLQRDISINVLLLAETEEAFLKKLKLFTVDFEKLIGDKINKNLLIKNMQLYQPSQAKSFGSINKTIFRKIENIARNEGFLTDPIYSAKLFIESEKIINSNKLSGNALIVHSGGGLALFGFQEQLAEQVRLT